MDRPEGCRFDEATWERYCATATRGRLFLSDSGGQYGRMNEEYQRRLRNRPAPAPHMSHIGVILGERGIAEVRSDIGPCVDGSLDRYTVGAQKLMIVEPQPVLTTPQVDRGISRMLAFVARKKEKGTLGYDWTSLWSKGRLCEPGHDICSEFAAKYLYIAWGDELFQQATGIDPLDEELVLPDDFFGFCTVMFEG